MKNKNMISIITGGAGFLGKQIFESLLELNHKKIIIIDNNKKSIESFKKVYKKFKNKFIIYEADICSERKILKINSEIINKFKKIDILINNAGITRDSLVLRMKNHQWDDVLNTNLKGAFYATKSVLRSMMKNKYGRIINITSIVGLQGNSGQSNYSASKAGLIGFSQSVAKEVASRGITINCIAPGWIETEMTNDLPQDIKSEIIKNIPIGKTGTTEDIAYTALFLASKESKYITGQTITVDGGRVIN